MLHWFATTNNQARIKIEISEKNAPSRFPGDGAFFVLSCGTNPSQPSFFTVISAIVGCPRQQLLAILELKFLKKTIQYQH